MLRISRIAEQPKTSERSLPFTPRAFFTRIQRVGQLCLSVLIVVVSSHNNHQVGNVHQEVVPVTKGIVESQETSPESPIQKSPSGANTGSSPCISVDQPYAANGSTSEPDGRTPEKESAAFSPPGDVASDRTIPTEGCWRSERSTSQACEQLIE